MASLRTPWPAVKRDVTGHPTIVSVRIEGTTAHDADKRLLRCANRGPSACGIGTASAERNANAVVEGRMEVESFGEHLGCFIELSLLDADVTETPGNRSDGPRVAELAEVAKRSGERLRTVTSSPRVARQSHAGSTRCRTSCRPSPHSFAANNEVAWVTPTAVPSLNM
jgi:hypothetical protein